MPTHRADTPALRRPRTASSGRRARKVTHRDRIATQAGELLASSLTAPKVGIAGVLGFATIVAPVSGVLTPPDDTRSVAVSAPVRADLAVEPVPEFPRLEAAPVNAVEQHRALPGEPLDVAESVPEALAAPREVVVTRVSRAQERPVLPGCDGELVESGAANGRLSKSDLCTLWDGRHMLRADAAVALAKLNIAYRAEFGDDLCLTDSYRSYGSQVSLASRKPGLAARPGTSNHGWGLAVDLCDGIEDASGARWNWMQDRAGDYGWINPDWARKGGNGPYEPWHWEFPGT